MASYAALAALTTGLGFAIIIVSEQEITILNQLQRSDVSCPANLHKAPPGWRRTPGRGQSRVRVGGSSVVLRGDAGRQGRGNGYQDNGYPGKGFQ